MVTIQEAINGRENQGDLSSPYQALVQFYCAFNSRNLQMMAENWARSDAIAMDNPLGGITRGWEEIRAVYARIFDGPARVAVEFYDYSLNETEAMFFAVGRERGYFRQAGKEMALAIRTSRIFQKMAGRWRQVHHHGSIDDPRLLAQYQAAVLGGKA